MKISNFGYIVKGLLYAVLGAVIAFFPGIISMFFYIIGGIIIISCVVSIISSGGDGVMTGAGIGGIIAGIFVILLPKIIEISIPIIAGIFFGGYGLKCLGKAFNSERSKDSRIFSAIIGALVIALGIFLIVNPFSAGKAARIAAGIALIVMGIFNFIVAYAINRRNKGSSPDIIDVNSYTVHDDKKFLH